MYTKCGLKLTELPGGMAKAVLLAAVLLACAAPTPAQPVASLSFDQAEGDLVQGTGLAGRLVEGARIVAEAKSGQGALALQTPRAHLNGGDSLGDLPAATVEMWIKPSKLGGIFLGKYGQMRLSLTAAGQLEGGLKDKAGVWHSCVSGVGAVAAGRWVHVALSWGPAGLRLWLSGVCVARDDYQGRGDFLAGKDLLLGVYGYPTSYESWFYEGLIDEMRVWDKQVEFQPTGAGSLVPLAPGPTKPTITGRVAVATDYTDGQNPSVEAVAAQARQEGLDFVLLADDAGKVKDKLDEYLAACRQVSRPEFHVIPGLLVTQVNPGERKSDTGGGAWGLPPRMALLVAPAHLADPTLPYFALTERVWNGGGLAWVMNPAPAWAEDPYHSFYLLRAFDVFGEAGLAPARSLLDQRLRLGFCGRKALVGLPGNAPLTERLVLDRLNQNTGWGSTSGDLAVDLSLAGVSDGGPLYRSSDEDLEIKVAVRSKQEIASCEVFYNGEEIARGRARSMTVKHRFLGQADIYARATDAGGHVCYTQPLFVKSKQQAWGDAHLHTINLPMMQSGMLNFAIHHPQVFGSGSQTGGFAPQPDIVSVPGGEFHGPDSKEDPGGHLIVVQQQAKQLYREKMGYRKTIEAVAQQGDFLIVAHPSMHAAKPEDIAVWPGQPGFDPRLNGLEIINTHPQIVHEKLAAKTGGGYKADASDHRLAEALWDAWLGLGLRVLGSAGNDRWDQFYGACLANNQMVGMCAFVARVADTSHLTVAQVSEAVRSGDCWIGDLHCRVRYLDVTLAGKRMGQVCSDRGLLELKVTAESLRPIRRVEVIKDGKLVQEVPLEGQRQVALTIPIQITDADRALRVRVGDAAAEAKPYTGLAYSNPIYLRAPYTGEEAWQRLGGGLGK